MTAPWQRFTDEQRRAAFLVDRSVISTAAAGSGKTQVMAVRYCACLLRDEVRYRPDRILAITFTREAAANLRARIDGVLRFILAQPTPSFPDYRQHGGTDAELSVQEIEHLTQALAQLPSAPIGTVDSFCLALVGDHADRLGRDPGLMPPSTDGPEWRQCQEAAWLALRAQAVRDPGGPLSAVVAPYGEAAARQVIIALAEQCSALPSGGAYAVGSDVLSAFLVLRQAQREALHDAFARMQAHLRACAAKGVVAERLRAIPPPPPWTEAADVRGAHIYAAWLVHFDEAKVAGKDPLLTALVRELQDALDYPCRRSSDGSRPALAQRMRCASLAAFSTWDAEDEERYRTRALALAACVERYRELLDEASAARSLAGFSATARACLQLLEQPTVAAAQAERYRHLLLDEAQDLNALQGALIERLWQVDPPPRVFAVGDHRQSIYGFRHAEPALFRRWEGGVEASGGTVAPLGQNFRSHPLLVTSVRALVSTPGLAREFRPDGILPGRAAEDFSARARFCCWLAAATQEDEPGPLAEAQLMASIIAESIIAGRAPEDHAVLLRTRTRMRLYADHFERAGIPVDTDFPGGLYDAQECWDVEAILRLCADVHDRYALACAVSGPWGVADPQDRCLLVEAMTLHSTAQASQRILEATALGALLGRVRPILASEGPASAIRALSRDPVLAQRYSALPLARRRLANLARLAQEQQGDASASDAAGFIARLAERRRLGADGAEAGGEALGSRGVRLLTIHAAKGLEWPVVLLPELADSFQDRDRRRVAVAEAGAAGLGLSCGAAGEETSCSLARFMALERLGGAHRAEDSRLFYVACTRAVEELHLIRSGDHAPEAEVRCAADWVDLAGFHWDLAPASAPTPQLTRIASEHADPLPALRVSLPRVQVQVRTVSELIAGGSAVAAAAVTEASASAELRRALGIRVHEALQRHGLGMAAATASAATASFHGLVDPLLLTALGSWMTRRDWVPGLEGCHQEVREQPVVSDLISGDGTRLVCGVVDLLVCDAHGRWHLYDYKTGDTVGLAHDQLQVRCYAHMCAAILPGGVASAHILDLQRGTMLDVPLTTPLWPQLLGWWQAVEAVGVEVVPFPAA